MITRVFLCRHGESDEVVRGRCHGRLDVGLSPLGSKQAEQLAEALADEPLAALYTSPLRRARETVLVVAERHSFVPVVLAGASEIDLGELEGLTYEDAERCFPLLYREWMQEPVRVRFPGGESYADLRRRAVAALAAILVRHSGETAALVSHAGPLRALLGHCLELPDTEAFRLELHYGTLSLVEWLDGKVVVRSISARDPSRARSADGRAYD